MKVTSLPELPVREPGEAGPRNVAIGTFDGVHVGHREVIRGSDTVLTFDPHPVAITHPEALPKLLNTFAIKRDLIGGLGVEELVVVPFDEEFASRSAEQFVQDVLIGQLGAERVSVGENFRFGAKAQGTPEFLASHDEFETRIVPHGGGGGGERVLDPDPRAGRGGRGGPGRPLPRAARSCWRGRW